MQGKEEFKIVKAYIAIENRYANIKNKLVSFHKRMRKTFDSSILHLKYISVLI